LLREQKADEAVGRAQEPSTWRGRSEQILLAQVGGEARKTSAVGLVFFLDFSLYSCLRWAEFLWTENGALSAAKHFRFLI